MVASLTQFRQDSGKLVQPFDTDLGLPQLHAHAVAGIKHPVWQLAAQIRPLICIDALQVLAATMG